MIWWSRTGGTIAVYGYWYTLKFSYYSIVDGYFIKMRFYQWEGGRETVLKTYLLLYWNIDGCQPYNFDLVEVMMYLKQCQLLVLENMEWMLFGFIFDKLIAYSFFLIWVRRVCNTWLYARDKALFNVCGLPELLVLRSGLFLSELVIFLCLFLNPCFILPGSHLQEEEMEEFGVSGWRQHTQTFILPLPFALFPTCYL